MPASVVHHERPVLRDRLADRAALQHERLGAVRAAGDRRRARRVRSDGAGRRLEVVVADAHRALEDVERADGVGARGRRQRPLRASGSSTTCQIARSASGRDAHELGGGGGGSSPPSAPAMTVTSVVRPSSSVDDVARDVLVPEHREVGLDHLVGGRQVQPDLEQLARVRARRGRAAGTSRSARCPRRR